MRSSRFRRRLVGATLAVYVAFVLAVTLTPQMPGRGVVGRVVDRFLYELHLRGITGIQFLDIEFFGNILMFVPLGVLTALLIPRRAWWMLMLMGTAFSGLIAGCLFAQPLPRGSRPRLQHHRISHRRRCVGDAALDRLPS